MSTISRVASSERTVDWKEKKFPRSKGPCRRRMLVLAGASTRSISSGFSCIDGDCKCFTTDGIVNFRLRQDCRRVAETHLGQPPQTRRKQLPHKPIAPESHWQCKLLQRL